MTEGWTLVQVDVDGETQLINLADMTRKEVARLFVKQTGEVRQLLAKLEQKDPEVKMVRATAALRLKTVRFMMAETVEAWLVANKEREQPPRDIHVEIDGEDVPF